MNFPTLIVLIIVVFVAFLAVRSMYKAKKSGKSCSCGGNYGGCPSAGMCHSDKNN